MSLALSFVLILRHSQFDSSLRDDKTKVIVVVVVAPPPPPDMIPSLLGWNAEFRDGFVR